MSNPKITPKNLSYDSTLPPFLQRLQNANADSGLNGRHERAMARPRRARTAQDEEDDMPTYVDEKSGDVVEKDGFAALVSGDKSAKEMQDNDHECKEQKNKAYEAQNADKSIESMAAIGATKKRKIGKVITTTDEVDDANKTTSAAETKRSSTFKVASETGNAQKPRKKAKKIKLSFNNDDDGL